MSHLLFESEVRQLMKMGLDKDLAILTASAKLEDKTLFHNTLARIKEENELIAMELQKAGFMSPTIIDEPTTNNEVKDI